MIGIRRKRSSVRSWRMSTMSTILSLLFFLSFPPLGKWPLFVRKQCWLLLLHSVENQWNFSTFLFFFFFRQIKLQMHSFVSHWFHEKITGKNFGSNVSNYFPQCTGVCFFFVLDFPWNCFARNTNYGRTHLDWFYIQLSLLLLLSTTEFAAKWFGNRWKCLLASAFFLKKTILHF